MPRRGPPPGPPPRRPTARTLALPLLVLLWALVSPVAAQDGFRLPALEFEVTEQGGERLFSWGANAFTGGQLARFVAAVPAFLGAVPALAEGEQLVLRQEGVMGYIAVSAVVRAGAVRYLLTFRAEPPGEIDEDRGVVALAASIGDQVLSRSGTR